MRDRCAPLWNILTEYSTNSTIHGVPYLTEKKFSLAERILWLIILLVSVVICSVFIFHIIEKWNRSPVIVTYASRTTSILDVFKTKINSNNNITITKTTYSSNLDSVSGCDRMPWYSCSPRSSEYNWIKRIPNGWKTIRTRIECWGIKQFERDVIHGLSEQRIIMGDHWCTRTRLRRSRSNAGTVDDSTAYERNYFGM